MHISVLVLLCRHDGAKPARASCSVINLFQLSDKLPERTQDVSWRLSVLFFFIIIECCTIKWQRLNGLSFSPVFPLYQMLLLKRIVKSRSQLSKVHVFIKYNWQTKSSILFNFLVPMQLQWSPEISELTFLYLAKWSHHHHRMQQTPTGTAAPGLEN